MMHHSPVDLSLAVTWVPGLTCVCKVICLECLLLAVRAHLDTFVGHTLVYLVLHVDRAVTHDLIFDSNTILVWIFLGSVFQTHREQAQSEPPAALLISCASLAWILCCACVLYEPHALRAALSSVRLRLPACTGTSPYPHNLPGKVLASFLTVFGVVVLLLVGEDVPDPPAVSFCRGVVFSLQSLAWLYLVGIHAPNGADRMRDNAHQSVTRFAPTLCCPTWMVVLYAVATGGILVKHFYSSRAPDTGWKPDPARKPDPAGALEQGQLLAPATAPTASSTSVEDVFRMAKARGALQEV